MIRLIKAGGLIGFSLFLLLACGGQPEVIEFSGSTMGTRFHVTVVEASAGLKQAELELDIAAVLADIDQKMSTYKADSELSMFNDAAIGEVVEVSSDTLEVIKQAMALAELSSGSFNPAIGPLVNLWGFGPMPQKDSVPSEDDIALALAKIDYKSVNVLASSLVKTSAIALDLSAIAKGYGVDKVAEYLQAKGIDNFLVEVGGEIRVGGYSPRRTAWRVGIEAPNEDYGIAFDAVTVTNKAVATSGDYRNYYEQDGKRYSHTIDPATGYPIEHNLASVTVIADSAARADGLATAINVMGPDKGLAFSELESLAVFMIVKTESGYNAVYTSSFEQYLQTE